MPDVVHQYDAAQKTWSVEGGGGVSTSERAGRHLRMGLGKNIGPTRGYAWPLPGHIRTTSAPNEPLETG